jgi:hypothetical protein
MVRAILDGSKTQTRRPVKPPPDTCHGGDGLRLEPWTEKAWADPGLGDGAYLKVPYSESVQRHFAPWAIGAMLYVRETWATVAGQPVYRASTGENSVRWRPSIHMPKWASRVHLRVTDVRVERVQSISMADVNAEGFESCEEFEGCFRQTWDAVYSKQGFGWDVNPWVWAVAFERMEAR